MYMDQNEHLPRRDRAGGDLMQLLGGCGEATGCRMTRGCDIKHRPGDFRGMARGEGISGSIGPQGGCGCEGDHEHGDDGNGVIGNAYPCGENGVEGRSLAMVYASVQVWRNAYDPQTALARGTLFRELDMPFYGDRKTDRGGNCRGC
jgi:hypothetical protein